VTACLGQTYKRHSEAAATAVIHGRVAGIAAGMLCGRQQMDRLGQEAGRTAIKKEILDEHTNEASNIGAARWQSSTRIGCIELKQQFCFVLLKSAAVNSTLVSTVAKFVYVLLSSFQVQWLLLLRLSFQDFDIHYFCKVGGRKKSTQVLKVGLKTPAGCQIDLAFDC